MNNRLLNVYGVLVMAGSCLLFAAGANAKPAKVDICHAPPDNPQNIQHIQVGTKGSALLDHLSHGDWVVTQDGMCLPLEGNTPIGTITADIVRGGIPPGVNRGVESAAVNLVADAQLWATSFNGAEIAFMNPGGVRSDLLYAQSDAEGDGVVTYGEAFAFQPFANTLVTFPMTGAQIVSVLEEQCRASSSRPFLHLGVSAGFTYDLAKTIVAGDCTSISVTNVKLGGTALSPVGTYYVTVNNFLASGGDNFPTFSTINPSLRRDGGNDLNALVNYLATHSPVAPPSIDRVNELP